MRTTPALSLSSQAQPVVRKVATACQKLSGAAGVVIAVSTEISELVSRFPLGTTGSALLTGVAGVSGTSLLVRVGTRVRPPSGQTFSQAAWMGLECAFVGFGTAVGVNGLGGLPLPTALFLAALGGTGVTSLALPNRDGLS